MWFWSALTLASILIAISVGYCAYDKRDTQRTWKLLAEKAVAPARQFDSALVQDLPEPAQRYFNYSILPGTALTSVVEIDMAGQFGLGDKTNPKYQEMQASQILAQPYGFIWRLKSGVISGSDGLFGDNSWTRFWVNGFLPVARAGGTQDHFLSSFGRMIADSLIWAPASLLPSTSVRWQVIDENSARVIVSHATGEQAVDIWVAENGQPTQVVFERWSDANPEKQYRWQPFGGYLSNFIEVEGYRLPTHVEAGNHFGTEDYFPFFIAEAKEIRLLSGGDVGRNTMNRVEPE